MAPPHVLISAHRCGGAVDPAYDNTPAGVRYAASIGADYVEFDVRRAADGSLVCCHDPVDDAAGRPVLDEVLAEVAACGLGAHVDLKGPGRGRVGRGAGRPVRRACSTSAGSSSRRATARPRRRSRGGPRRTTGLALVGLTVGQSTSHLRLPAAVRARIGELYPTRRWRDSGAGVLVAHHLLARVRLLRWARRREVRVLVWTVDSPRVVAAALRDPRVWMVTTNRPGGGRRRPRGARQAGQQVT